MASQDSDANCQSVYPYDPSLPLAAVAVSFYAIVVGLHVWRLILTRAWDNIFMVIGGFFQLVGYAARLYLSQNVCSKSAYGAQAVLLLLGPSTLMFTVTLTHTQYIKALNADKICWLPIRMQRPLYFCINFLCIFVQGVGGIDMAAASERGLAEAGGKIKIASFVAQMVFWVFIASENGWVTYRYGALLRRSANRAQDESGMVPDIKPTFARFKLWSQLFGLAISIIVGRNMMRLTELGVDFLKNNEWPGYAFDGYQMVVVMGAWGVFCLPGKCKEVLASHERYQHLELMRSNSSQERALV
ncbi:hypothetical protein M409DRAFT_55651 [Zasmidium cellare ATCC 36951]|uniref:RTA1 like protein n=1 Tax=Zasmidium cellare ATCC 36951 TaxID=1080233 RepID=A0A6A6CGK8_ZASCE|nr:uncharacterized protein M409DRAFT_55651 [Zasmidium cellare ATCC 36951]KAF2165783.1 hypothetical protein M409DRAFT_55651 [Zasmidium cellare ATCC 36951]